MAEGSEDPENGNPYPRIGVQGPEPRFPIPLLCWLTHSHQSVFFALLEFLGTGQSTYMLYLVDRARVAPRKGDSKCPPNLGSHLSLHMGRLEIQERSHKLLPTLWVPHSGNKFLVSRIHSIPWKALRDKCPIQMRQCH